MTHKGKAGQTLAPLWCWNWHCQNSNSSTTDLGITQDKVKTKDHLSVAIEQWRSRWSMNSPLHLHIQHQSTIKMCLLWRLLTIRIFKRPAVHTKNTILLGTLTIQMLFQGKKVHVEPLRALWYDLNSNTLFNGNHMTQSWLDEVGKLSYSTSKKVSTDSNCQSCEGWMNWGFNDGPLPLTG